MSEHRATIEWQRRPDADFVKGRFSREHTWGFDGGISVPASASPSVVPAPFSTAAAIDPEEAFVASLSSCHMLTFLFLAGRQGFVVDRYVDDAAGVLEKRADGARWIAKVTLRPRITFAGDKVPTAEEETKLHHTAHEQCFVANSVKTEIAVEPTRG